MKQSVKEDSTFLDQLHQFALGFGVAVDISLCRLQTCMARELLHIAYTPPDFRNFACGPGDERPASRMTATSGHT